MRSRLPAIVRMPFCFSLATGCSGFFDSVCRFTAHSAQSDKLRLGLGADRGAQLFHDFAGSLSSFFLLVYFE